MIDMHDGDEGGGDGSKAGDGPNGRHVRRKRRPMQGMTKAMAMSMDGVTETEARPRPLGGVTDGGEGTAKEGRTEAMVMPIEGMARAEALPKEAGWRQRQ